VGKIILIDRERARLFNDGYDDAYEDTGCNIDLYENNVHYRRGYDAGERDIDEDASGTLDHLSDSERELLYGNEKDQV
jgi:hypothetical protein